MPKVLMLIRVKSSQSDMFLSTSACGTIEQIPLICLQITLRNLLIHPSENTSTEDTSLRAE
ncbi:MAG: hypothetical protein IJV33_08740 [Bacteroidaceae bacterium]|nr:hypothetical protein [Bacteroidaceae bacterium]